MKKSSPHVILQEKFRQFIKASASGRRLTPSGRKITTGTIVNYRYVLKIIGEFETKYDTCLRIQLLHRTSVRLLLREKNYWNRFIIQFLNFLYTEKGYYDNYVASVLKILKTFFNHLEKEKGLIIGNYHKAFRAPVQQSTPVVLLPEQLNFLITNRDFENSLSMNLKRVKDIFVFGCSVGLRYSDLMNLKITNIVFVEDNPFLRLFSRKTGAEIKIPLPGYLVNIIDKYRRKKNKYILPGLSSTNLNIQVKKLIKAAGWSHTLTKTMSYKGKMVEIKNKEGNSWSFYEHITAHTMRRTAITTLLILGVPEMMVRKISGHAPGSKEFYKYVGIAQEYLSRELSNAYKKLVEPPSSLVIPNKD